MWIFDDLFNQLSTDKYLSHLIFFDIINDTATLIFVQCADVWHICLILQGGKNPHTCISASKYMHVFKIFLFKCPITPETVLRFYFPISLSIYILFKIPCV